MFPLTLGGDNKDDCETWRAAKRLDIGRYRPSSCRKWRLDRSFGLWDFQALLNRADANGP